MIHDQPHPLAGKIVRLSLLVPGTTERINADIKVEDWWDRVSGSSWTETPAKPSCMMYMARRLAQNQEYELSGESYKAIPADDEVLYGMGTIFHVSEIIPVESGMREFI